MFLLIHGQASLAYRLFNLHSNMFLLIQRLPCQEKYFLLYLHSNMFLLIQVTGCGETYTLTLFTFQYVSINTIFCSEVRSHAKTFTFQYVSINTTKFSAKEAGDANLHSNMFLLIPVFHKGLSDKNYSTTFCRPCHFLFFQDP